MYANRIMLTQNPYKVSVAGVDSRWPDWLSCRVNTTRRENFLLQSSLCVLTFIRCPFHSHVTAVARKTPRSFCQKCRWQVTPKHTYALDPTKSEWADHAARHSLGIYRKRAYTWRQKQSATVVSARWIVEHFPNSPRMRAESHPHLPPPPPPPPPTDKYVGSVPC